MPVSIPAWFFPIVVSAVGLGFYDICKKHAVRDNSVMPVLFLATLSGSVLFVACTLLFGNFAGAIVCSLHHWLLLLGKSLIVAASWTCVYYAMRELPISIAAPIRASAPLWTFIGSLILFGEVPTVLQGIGMLLIFVGYYVFSVLGKLEGISFRGNLGVHLILLGTLLGAVSALYDKYLLNVIRIPRDTVQLWFSIDLVAVLGLAWLIRRTAFGQRHRFVWRWTIPATGILLIAATMAVNEQTVFNNDRFDVEIDFGVFPLLYRSGRFSLTLANRSANAPEVYALNLDGTRERKLKTSFRNGTLSITMDTSKFEYGTPFFEILYP